MKPRYYIKMLTPDGRLVNVDIRPRGFHTFDDAVAFLDIHGAVVITVIERTG